MEANKISLKTLVLSLGAILGLETVFYMALSGKTGLPLAALGALRGTEALLLLYIAFRFDKSPDAVGLSRATLLPGLKKGMMWAAGFAVAAGVLFIVLRMAGVNALAFLKAPLPARPHQIFIFFLVGGIIGPIWEEIFFRGIIFGFFRRWGSYAAILTSSVLFVLPHFDGSHLPLTQIVGGIVFAVSYEREKSLVVPITIHCLGNMAIFSVTLIS